MKKKIILGCGLILILVCVMSVIFTSKLPKTVENVSNTNDEIEEVENNDLNNIEEVSYEKFVGVYVPEDDFYLEGLFITFTNDEYEVRIKDPKGTYTDNVAISEMKDGKIESNLIIWYR